MGSLSGALRYLGVPGCFSLRILTHGFLSKGIQALFRGAFIKNAPTHPFSFLRFYPALFLLRRALLKHVELEHGLCAANRKDLNLRCIEAFLGKLIIAPHA